VGPGNCCMLPSRQSWDRLRELEIRIKVRVMGAAAVASPPTGVMRELCEVCQPQFPAGAGRRTSRQRAKLLEAYCVRFLRGKVRVQKVLVGEFVIGVV